MKLLFSILFLCSCTAKDVEQEFFIPKNFGWDTVKPTVVSCPDVDEENIQEALKILPQNIEMDYLGRVETCFCDPEKYQIPYGLIEIFYGELEDGVEGRTTFDYDSDGYILGACISLRPKKWSLTSHVYNLISAHEVAHSCGYGHALYLESQEPAWLHLMSPNVEMMKENTDGMDLKCNEANDESSRNI